MPASGRTRMAKSGGVFFPDQLLTGMILPIRILPSEGDEVREFEGKEKGLQYELFPELLPAGYIRPSHDDCDQVGRFGINDQVKRLVAWHVESDRLGGRENP
jgi:hypothetical protein